MKKTILIIIAFGLSYPNSYSQKVYKQGNKVYLECTIESGMPSYSVTNDSKCVGGIASNKKYRNGDISINSYATENDKVYEKLEIDLSDNLNASSATMDWVTAYNGCKAKSDAGWRLPSQRELILMFIFKPALDSIFAKIGGSSFNGTYWSSSEKSATKSWTLNFIGSTTFTNDKTSTYIRARCVKEVTL